MTGFCWIEDELPLSFVVCRYFWIEKVKRKMKERKGKDEPDCDIY